jgi:CPA1 family monovalent cation:H+ antiporter
LDKESAAYPIFLTVAGLLISFIPGIPTFQVDLVLFSLSSCLLFFLKRHEYLMERFSRFRRPILGLAFGWSFTSIVVAYLSSNMIPGITVAMGSYWAGLAPLRMLLPLHPS